MAKKTKKAESKPEIEARDPSSKLTREQLEGYLWATSAFLPRPASESIRAPLYGWGQSTTTPSPLLTYAPTEGEDLHFFALCGALRV